MDIVTVIRSTVLRGGAFHLGAGKGSGSGGTNERGLAQWPAR